MCESGDMHDTKNTATVHGVYLEEMGELCPSLLFIYRKAAVNTNVVFAVFFL